MINKMIKTLDYISIIMFFAITAVLGIFMIFIRTENAEQKNTEYTDNSCIRTAEKYAEENFPFRNNWQSVYARISKLLGNRMFGDIYLDSCNNRLIQVFSEYDSDTANSNIDAINSFFDARSRIPCYIMLVPSASGIYHEDMPESLGAIDEQKLIDEIYYDINEKIIPLDVYNPLYSMRDSYIYFRTDPYWTQMGAYEAYAASASKLGFTAYTVSNYDVDYTHVDYQGSLSRLAGIKTKRDDTINSYRGKYGSYVKSTKLRRDKQTYAKTSVYNSSGLQNSNKYSYFFGNDNFKCAEIETASENDDSLLIIGTEYANCFVPFLAPHYSHITLIDPEKFDDDDTLASFTNIDEYSQIMFLYDIVSFCNSQKLSCINE